MKLTPSRAGFAYIASVEERMDPDLADKIYEHAARDGEDSMEQVD